MTTVNASLLLFATALLLLGATDAKMVTITTESARMDVDGNYIDAHDGKIVVVNGTYYLYGEAYGNQTLATAYPWKNWPRLKVYTSPDMISWTFRADPLPMIPNTLWIPNVIYQEATQTFIMWFGSGGWQTATSTDGINFTPSKYGGFFSRFGAKGRTDGTGILFDDDGTGYVAFASDPPGFDEPGNPKWPGHPDAHGYGHIVSIEKMSADLLTSSKVNVTGLFPDDYVESPSLFKRSGRYYLTYGSCCCGCSEGGGQVVWSAKAIGGPWVKQGHADINCVDASSPVCGGYGRRDGDLKNLIYNAQWWGASHIPLANGKTKILYLGRRWLSGPNLPTGCFDICGNGPPRGHGNKALCQVNGDKYLMKTDKSVWYPLEFDEATGDIMPMTKMQSYTLDLPDHGQ